jgi:hypothetical protein
MVGCGGPVATGDLIGDLRGSMMPTRWSAGPTLEPSMMSLVRWTEGDTARLVPAAAVLSMTSGSMGKFAELRNWLRNR